MKREITCEQSDDIRRTVDLAPASSLTNYIAGEVIDPTLPPRTSMVWEDRTTGQEVLEDRLDADGCRHWDLRSESE